jgi:hypothetical protein
LSRKFLQIFTKKFADPKKNKKGRFLAIRGTFIGGESIGNKRILWSLPSKISGRGDWI